MELGKKQFQQKDYGRAVLNFRNAIQATPKAAEPYYQLGLAYLAMEDLRLAAGCFQRASELDPKHTAAQLKLADLMSQSRARELIEEAEKRARNVLNLLPDDVEALNVLAFTELRLGKPESAEAHLEQALRKSPAHLKSSVSLARARLQRKDVAGAEQALQEAVSRNPQSPAPVVQLGEFYLALQKTGEAERQFRRALEIDPKHGPALLDLGGMQARAGQMQQAEETYRQISLLPDRQYQPVYGLFLFQAGKRDQAVAEFARLARENPDDRDSRTRLVAAYLGTGKTGEAEKVLGAALKKNPNDADALLQRSRIYLASGRYAEAQNDLSQVLRFRRQSAEAHYLLSKVHQGRGETASRQQELGEALRADPAYLLARVDFAQMLIASRGASSALRLLDEAPQEQRQAPAVLLQRNWAMLSLGQKAEARKGIDQLLALGKFPGALLQDSLLKLDQKDYNGARATAEQILAQNPEDPRALRILVDAHAAQKQLPLAVRRVREHAAQHAKSAPLQQFLGQFLAAHGDRPEARKAFQAAKANDAKLVAADLALAELDIAEGKLDSARNTLSAVLAENQRNLGARLLLAGLDERQDRRAAAIEHYRKVLDIDSGNIAALNNLAYLLTAETSQTDEALRHAQRAKELAPDSPAVDDTLGWAYFQKGLYVSAVRHLENAASRESTPRRQYHLAMAYAKAGDRRARQAFETGLKLDPTLPEAAAARQLVESLPR